EVTNPQALAFELVDKVVNEAAQNDSIDIDRAINAFKNEGPGENLRRVKAKLQALMGNRSLPDNVRDELAQDYQFRLGVILNSIKINRVMNQIRTARENNKPAGRQIAGEGTRLNPGDVFRLAGVYFLVRSIDGSTVRFLRFTLDANQKPVFDKDNDFFEHDFSKGAFTVGRESEGNTMALEGEEFSRKHAEVSVNSDGKLILIDRGSRNGTFYYSGGGPADVVILGE